MWDQIADLSLKTLFTKTTIIYQIKKPSLMIKRQIPTQSSHELWKVGGPIIYTDSWKSIRKNHQTTWVYKTYSLIRLFLVKIASKTNRLCWDVAFSTSVSCASGKSQHKDVYRRTIEILQCGHIFKVNCCLKAHNASLKLALPISG